jgi:hypothetical protein
MPTTKNYTEQMNDWCDTQIGLYGESNFEVKLLTMDEDATPETLSKDFITLVGMMERGELHEVKGSVTEHMRNKFGW